MDAIFLDLDGTLTDPKIGITRSIQYALTALDHPVPAEQDLLWCIGPPLKTSFKTMLGSEALAERAVALYRERFSDIGIFENSVYDGIPELLAGLVGGPRLFVATSKLAVFAERLPRISNGSSVPDLMARWRKRRRSCSTRSSRAGWMDAAPSWSVTAASTSSVRAITR
jgi:beta-phosphoglucomutase-like phosphatase (HAD superfamily)